jgi:hypothetical protein
MEVSDQPHASDASPQRKSLQYAFNRRLGGPQGQTGRFGDEKNLSLLPVIKLLFITCPAFSLVIIPTALPRLRECEKNTQTIQKENLTGSSKVGERFENGPEEVQWATMDTD